MKRLRLRVTIALATLFSVTMAMAQVDPNAQLPVDPELRQGVLSNGMTYYIRHNDRRANQADFYILSDVGAIQEDDDQQGLAHFLEHMAFNGTKNLPGKKMINYLESIGVKFGYNLNAGTGWDNTTYMMKDVPVTREGVVDSALLILHDWSAYITPQPAEIDAERGVIKEELRTRDGAQWRSTMALIKSLGKGTKYEHRNLIGYLDFLETFEYDALTRFYKEWYRPDYQAVIIVGDIDVDHVEKKITSLMSDIPAAAADASKKEVIMVPQNEEPIITIFTDPEMTSSTIQWYNKGEATPKEYNNLGAVAYLNAMKSFMTTMQNYRLQEVMMEQNSPLVYAGAYTGGIGVIPTLECISYNTVPQKGKIAAAFERTYTEMERTRRHGFNPSEFERAQADILSSAESRYNNRENRENGEFVNQYISNFTTNTPIMSAEDRWQVDSTIYATLNVDMINQYVQSLSYEQNNVIMISAPESESANVPTEQEIKDIIAKVAASEIAPLEDTAVKVPLIDPSIELPGSAIKSEKHNKRFDTTTIKLKNGIEIEVKQTDFKRDEIILDAYTRGGAARLSDAEYHAGLLFSTFTDQMGLSKFSSNELAKQLAGKKVSASAYVNRNSHGFEGSTTPKDLETLMQIIYLYFTDARFDEGDFNILYKQLLSFSENMDKDPNFIAGREQLNTLYNKNPRAHEFSHEIAEGLKFSEIESVYNQLFANAADFKFYIIGNVDLETFKPLAEKYLGSLPTSKSKMGYKDDGMHKVEGEVVNDFTTKMEQPKVSVYYSYTGKMKYNEKNIVAARYLESALTNDYLESIREDKGGSYGVSARMQLSGVPSDNFALTIRFDTNPEMADELMSIVRPEIEKIAAEGVDEEQMSKTREFLAKEIGNWNIQNGMWNNYLIAYDNYGLDLYKDAVELSNSITSKDVQKMAQQILDSGNVVKVVMRPRAE